jgi:putative transposase
MDNGPEFLGTAFVDAWAVQYGVTLHIIQPGKLVRNVFIESFTGRFRDECLNEHWFLMSQEARVVVEAWRQESDARTHSAIGDVTKMEFIRHYHDRSHAAQESTSLALV